MAGGHSIGPDKKGHNRTRIGVVITEIEVIGIGIVEVDGLFDQAQTEHLGIEINVLLGIVDDSSDVMQAEQ